MDNLITIGILDDDPSKRTTLIGLLRKKEYPNSLKEKYSKYNLDIKELNLTNQSTVNSILLEIEEFHIDCILIDYKLNNSIATKVGNGVTFAKELLAKYADFPLFIVTSYEGDLYDQEAFPPEQVIDYVTFTQDEKHRLIISGKIIELVLNYKREEDDIKKQLHSLLEHKGKNDDIDAQILELDTKLEKRLNGTSSIPTKTKAELKTDKLKDLLQRIDAILEKGDQNGDVS